MLVLYEHPLSPYAQKVKIALREKGIAFEVRMPEGIGAGHTKGEFADANPRREVPALIDGDAAIFDSTIILDYIDDKWPEPALMPDAPEARARVRQIEDVMDTHFEAVTWGLGELRFFKRGDDALRKRIEANAGKQNWEIMTGSTAMRSAGPISASSPTSMQRTDSALRLRRDRNLQHGSRAQMGATASARPTRNRAPRSPAWKWSARRSRPACSSDSTATTGWNG